MAGFVNFGLELFSVGNGFSESYVDHTAIFSLQNTFPPFLNEFRVGYNCLLEVVFIIFLKNDIDPISTKCQGLFTLHRTTSYIVVQTKMTLCKRNVRFRGRIETSTRLQHQV